jgi:hypothetical protein
VALEQQRKDSMVELVDMLATLEPLEAAVVELA